MKKTRLSADASPLFMNATETTIVHHHRKDLHSITLQQQQSRLSSVLDSIRVLAEIAALALQLLSNRIDDRQVAKVSKSIVHDSFHGQFANTLKKEVDVNKSLFLLDFWKLTRGSTLNDVNICYLETFTFLLITE